MTLLFWAAIGAVVSIFTLLLAAWATGKYKSVSFKEVLGDVYDALDFDLDNDPGFVFIVSTLLLIAWFMTTLIWPLVYIPVMLYTVFLWVIKVLRRKK